jgi:hypothetical protein
MKTVNVLACVALLVFAWLTLRHVHDSVFLEDQVDQLQNFESLLHVEPSALLGPAMSDTRPTAHALGPTGAVLFGLPVMLGLGIDGIHVVTSLLIAVATAVAFVTLLRIDDRFAWLWFWIFSAAWIVWWNASLLWVNTLLLPAGLLLLALGASCLWRPTRFKLALLVLVAVLAAHVHLAALVAAPVVAIVTAATGRGAIRHPWSRREVFAIGLLAIAAFGPYLAAEALTGFQNSRAMVAHLQQTTEAQPLAMATPIQTLLIAADPTHVFASIGVSNAAVLAITSVLATFVVVALYRRVRTQGSSPRKEAGASRVLLWLTLTAIAAIIGQAIFFLLMRRPLAGYQYVTLLAPFYAVLPAAFLGLVLARPLHSRGAVSLVACACVVFLVWTGPSRADRSMAPAMWSYRNIVRAIDDLCGDGAADTAEGPGFAEVLNPKYDGVLQYLMKRRFSSCRYEPGAALLIAANRERHYEDWYVVGNSRYRRDTVRFPGIALYRRVPTAATGP